MEPLVPKLFASSRQSTIPSEPTQAESSHHSHDESVGNSEERPRNPVAKWGAACSTCATAKAKCTRLRPNAGSKCDRCVQNKCMSKLIPIKRSMQPQDCFSKASGRLEVAYEKMQMNERRGTD